MLAAPEPLAANHALERFDSGVVTLDEWLRRRAAANHASGASRTYVVCDAEQVVGYYALASHAVAAVAATGRVRRNMPDPVPVVVLGRPAVARSHQGQGLARALFQDAARRVMHAAETIGIRALLVHALSDEAKAFYLRLGLDPSPLDPMTLMVTVADPRSALEPDLRRSGRR
jgi:GNAT superfamily N-acetyltransferase